ncbi:unnamed protein product [Pieris brassicae]|uniref:Cytochrome c oxidase polypeptide VIII n=1 Tax=Pieris brassicae TaxID=7116 RepID=A0A9P0XFM9_PIEBR|nr:unnamed protein product [Pieris brassicae]
MQAVRSLLRTTQVVKNAPQVRNMSVVSIPTRNKVSKGEMITLSVGMVFGWLFIPGWVLVNMKNYRSKE